MIGNRSLGIEGARKGQFMKRIGIGKRLFGHVYRRQVRGQGRIIAEGATRQGKFLRQPLNAVRSFLPAGFLKTAVAMQRDGPANRGVGAIAPLAMLDKQVVIIEAEPRL